MCALSAAQSSAARSLSDSRATPQIDQLKEKHWSCEDNDEPSFSPRGQGSDDTTQARSSNF
jgi:hypothetical protein